MKESNNYLRPLLFCSSPKASIQIRQRAGTAYARESHGKPIRDYNDYLHSFHFRTRELMDIEPSHPIVVVLAEAVSARGWP